MEKFLNFYDKISSHKFLGYITIWNMTYES